MKKANSRRDLCHNKLKIITHEWHFLWWLWCIFVLAGRRAKKQILGRYIHSERGCQGTHIYCTCGRDNRHGCELVHSDSGGRNWTTARKNRVQHTLKSFKLQFLVKLLNMLDYIQLTPAGAYKSSVHCFRTVLKWKITPFQAQTFRKSGD